MAGGKKFDLTKSSIVEASANALWPVVADVPRWAPWFRAARGQAGLEKVEELPYQAGALAADTPELGKLFRFTFTNGFRATFQLHYWMQPSQVSLRMLPETREQAHGIEGFILDFDLFPRPDGTTQVWFGATVMMERGVHPGVLARWPKREIMGWVEGFHARLVREGPTLAGGAVTKKEVAALRGAGGK